MDKVERLLKALGWESGDEAQRRFATNAAVILPRIEALALAHRDDVPISDFAMFLTVALVAMGQDNGVSEEDMVKMVRATYEALKDV